MVINLSSGVFIFPPKPETNLLKVARYSHGFEMEAELDSGPKSLKNNAASSFIPDEVEDALRRGLSYILPQFAARPWSRRRLCWYSDTPEGNFIIDTYPGLNGLFIAAGGAGQ